MNWNDVLKPYSSQALSAMCAALGINEFAGKVTPLNRPRAIDALRRQVGRPETVRRALEVITPAETAIIKTLIGLGGRAETQQVRREIEQSAPFRRPTVAPSQPSPGYQGAPSFDDAAARAMCYGLVFSRDNREIDFKPGRQLYIPEPVLAILRTDPAWVNALARTNITDIQLSPVHDPEVAATSSAADFQRGLSRYLRHVRRQRAVPLTTQGWIYKSNFKSFLAALNAPADAPGDEASHARLWFMRRLLAEMGELDIDGAAFHPHPNGKLLILPIAQRIKLAFETWTASGAWNELNRIATEHQGYDYRRDAPPELAKARSAILRQMAHLATHAIAANQRGHWFATAQLIELARRSEYQFLFPRKQRYIDLTGTSGYYNTPYYGTNNPYGMTFPTVQGEQQGWEAVERQVIVAMLSGPLHWMGLVNLGYRKGATPGEGVEPSAYRLTEEGEWLLGLAEQPQFVESGGRVLIQPNFTVIAMEPISDAVLIDLDEFAEPQGGDRAITYHLTRQSVYHAQRQGWDAQRISAFLEMHQGAPIPANVQRSLEEWQTQHERITFHRAARVIQYADESAREGVQDTLARVGAQRQALSPAFELVENSAGKPLTIGQLSKALSEAGWLALVTPAGGGPAHTESSLRISENGEVTFKQAVPSLFALSQLRPFTENGDGRLRISAPSVRAAMSRGMQLDELLASLAHLHDGPLPARVETSIRAWAGFYGEAALRPVHVLELSSLEVFNNLLEDAEIGQYLKPIEGSIDPLALVDAAHVELVRKMLTERGVTLK
ncbi:MAG: helicase-associated domain-containing protein [Chloroflexi bacterium]|nr:helicase-associated domain-containing protein [Chloroflexota bacterium]